MFEFNINSKVKVKLTKYGRMELEQKFDHQIEEDENGYSELQMWVLISKLGDACTWGNAKLPFETKILIKDEDLTKRRNDELY